MREFKGDWKDLFNGFVLALDFRKMFLGFLGILFTILVCGSITYVFAKNLYPDEKAPPLPENLAPHEMWITLTTCLHTIYTGHPDLPNEPTPWYASLIYTLLVVPTFLLIWGLFGGAIARIAAYEIARDGERIETAKALKFSWTKFSSFFMAPMICILGFVFFYVCNVLGGALTKLLDLLYIGGPIGAILLPLALLSGFIMILIAIGSLVGAPLFFPAVAAEGTDSFDAMSRGFSYVYSRPWHFAWYQGVAAAYGWICVGFVLVFTVMMCYLGVYACAEGFDWVARWRDQNMYGMSLEEGQKQADERGLYAPKQMDIQQPDANATKEDWAKWERQRQELHEAIGRELLSPGVTREGEPRDLLVEFAQRAVLAPDVRYKTILDKHMDELEKRDSQLADALRSGRAEPSTGDSRLHHVNIRAWDQVLSRARNHRQVGWYDWSPRRIVTEPHPYGRIMWVLNCSVSWKSGHGGEGARFVGVDRTIADRSADELGWGYDMKATYWIVMIWIVLAMGLAYGYAVSYFISQQTVIYFLLRKKVDGIEMNEVFEEPEAEEPLPEITKPADSAPAPAAAPAADEKKDDDKSGKKKK